MFNSEIRDLRYSLLGYLENDLVLYRVRYLPDKQAYSITAKRIDQWLQYNRLVLGDRFFQALSNINFKEVVNKQENLEWYIVSSSGHYITSAEKKATHYLFKDDEMILLDDSDLPISGFNISLYGMREVYRRETSVSFTRSNYIKYWFQQW